MVLTKAALGFIELEQTMQGLPDAYTDLANPDFGKLAEGSVVSQFEFTPRFL